MMILKFKKVILLWLVKQVQVKHLMAKTVARMLNVPLAIVDATVLTEAGYVGEDVESILTRLLQAADYSLEKAEKGYRIY